MYPEYFSALSSITHSPAEWEYQEYVAHQLSPSVHVEERRDASVNTPERKGMQRAGRQDDSAEGRTYRAS
ncbi:hypothetical protein [Fulvivirga sedimenti]|uniref:Uncharacterized protein n=1 Tax=Fulvivirga sedimenti TaxID=2879465 RepID=A0A9X1HYK3_9BACT|nr:hypothetical protein [Fulvivirga sedimenti]MCA6078809.1 hypothetical protein [Fulvivirga sedimenti]